jgi:3-oxoadipyl-CoA thiolase
MISEVFVVNAVRTPIGKHGGALSPVRPDDLLALAFRTVIEQSSIDPALIDEVYAGCANQAGEDNRNVARMSALLAGFPVTVPAVTLNRLCGSGLSAVTAAYRMIALGDARLVVAGGVESMSRSPLVQAKATKAYQQGVPELADSTIGWRFVNPRMRELHPPTSMGETAENVADRYAISRDDQDAFALRSHQASVAAWARSFYAGHVVPVEVVNGRSTQVVTTDENPRSSTSLEALGKLRPAFRAGGTVTAGNSSSVNDGAAALLLASEAACSELGLEPVARVVATSTAGVEPAYMGMGPVPATRKVLERAGWDIADLDSAEINEAFAAQSLAVIRELGLDPDRVNPDGGAIALGHPLGMSGIRLVSSLVQRMRNDRAVRRGLASLCIGVGQGESLLLESSLGGDR